MSFCVIGLGQTRPGQARPEGNQEKQNLIYSDYSEGCLFNGILIK